jgi:hypothetical protein
MQLILCPLDSFLFSVWDFISTLISKLLRMHSVSRVVPTPTEYNTSYTRCYHNSSVISSKRMTSPAENYILPRLNNTSYGSRLCKWHKSEARTFTPICTTPYHTKKPVTFYKKGAQGNVFLSARETVSFSKGRESHTLSELARGLKRNYKPTVLQILVLDRRIYNYVCVSRFATKSLECWFSSIKVLVVRQTS